MLNPTKIQIMAIKLLRSLPENAVTNYFALSLQYEFSLFHAITNFFTENCTTEEQVNEWYNSFIIKLSMFDSYVIDIAVYDNIVSHTPNGIVDGNAIKTEGYGSTFRYVYDDGETVTGGLSELISLGKGN